MHSFPGIYKLASSTQPTMIKRYPYAFTGDELRDGCRRSVENVKGLLNSASLLVKNRDSQQYALGLYVYAVEEFGKAILLREYFTGNEERYQIPGWIFGDGRPTIDSINN